MLKKVLAIAIAGVLTATTLVGCTGDNKKGKSDKETLVISTWGLNEDKLWENLFTPFEQEHNVKIVLETGNNSERLTKLKNNKNSNIDIMYLAESFAEQGSEAGIFENIDTSKLTNAENLTDNSKKVLESGNGLPYTLNAIGIIVSPKAGVEINTWEDLWKPELKGKIAIPDITTTNGPLMLAVAGDKAKVDLSKDNGKAALKELEGLKPNVVKTYSKSSDLANMFASEEIQVAVAANFMYDMVSNNMKDAKFIIPESGTYLNFNTININKNSAKKDLAYKFMDYVIGAESQKRNVLGLDESPVNKNVELSAEESKNLIYGQVAEEGKVLDYKFINSQMQDWIGEWNKIMN